MVGCTTIASDKFMKISIHGFIIYLISEPKTWQLQPFFPCLILLPWPQTNKLLAWGWGLHHRSFRSGSSICRVHKHAFQVRLPFHANQSHISLRISMFWGFSFQSLNRTRSQCWPGVLWRCATFHADLVPIDDLRFLDGLCTAYDRGSTLDRRTHFDDVWLSNCQLPRGF